MGTQQQVSVDARMQIGQVTESIEVSGAVTLVEDLQCIAGPGDRQPEAHGTAESGPQSIHAFETGAERGSGGQPAYNRMEDQSGSSQISIAGGPVRGNNYLVDGIPITDSDNRAIIIPSLEAVEEVKIQANTYDAEMARTRRRDVQYADEVGRQYLSRQPVRPLAADRLGCQQFLQQCRRRADLPTSPTIPGAPVSAAR